MRRISRRNFLRTGTLSAAALGLQLRTPALHADPLGLPVGLQLYSVRATLPKDFAGTLHQVAALGYHEVEAAGFFGHSAAEVKSMMSDAGLRCVSAHYSLTDLLKDTDATIAYAHGLGLEYVICSFPFLPNPERFANTPGGVSHAIQHGMTVDDWKWNADQFNQLGRRFEAQGIHFGYHNHTMEFRDIGGTNGLDTLLKNTDPHAVCIEMDCGWVAAAGRDPVEYLRNFPGRFSMFHVKDLKPAAAGANPDARVSTELGHGTVDYRPIFKAAKNAGIRHCFVEQEKFDIPPLEALKIDYEYMHALPS